jgi:hypothetical protein
VTKKIGTTEARQGEMPHIVRYVGHVPGSRGGRADRRGRGADPLNSSAAPCGEGQSLQKARPIATESVCTITRSVQFPQKRNRSLIRFSTEVRPTGLPEDCAQRMVGQVLDDPCTGTPPAA